MSSSSVHFLVGVLPRDVGVGTPICAEAFDPTAPISIIKLGVGAGGRLNVSREGVAPGLAIQQPKPAASAGREVHVIFGAGNFAVLRIVKKYQENPPFSLLLFSTKFFFRAEREDPS